MADPVALLEVAFGWGSGEDPDDPSAPSIYGVGAVQSNIGAITCPMPAGVSAGDILVLILETNDQAITIASPTGWTQVASSPSSEATDTTRLTIFWKRAIAGEPSVVTSDSGDHQVGQVVGVTGCIQTGDPWDVTTNGNEATSDTSGSVPGVTTTQNKDLVLFVASTSRDFDTTTEFSAWTNANIDALQEQCDIVSSQGLGGGFGMAAGAKLVAGATGATAVTYATATRKAFWTGALKRQYSWTDITAYIRNIDVSRGKQQELDEFQAGTATFVLDNTDQRFDRDNAGTPYGAANLVPGVHIRLKLDALAVFRGFVRTWQLSYPAKGLDAIVTVPCVDAFHLLANLDIADSVWERNVRPLPNKKAWYRLGEPTGASVVTDSDINHRDALAVGAPSFGEQGQLYDKDTAVAFSDTGLDYINIPATAGVTAVGWALEALIKREKTPAVSANSERIFFQSNADFTQSIDFSIFDAGSGFVKFIVFAQPASAIVHGANGAGASLADGHLHHLMVTYTSTALTLYVDGVQVAQDTYAADTTAFEIASIYLGRHTGGTPYAYQGILDEFIIYSDSTGLVPADHADWALTPLAGERVDTAIGLALDDIGWPTTLRNLGTAASLLQAHELGGTALAYIQRLVETEEGLFYASADGKLTFRSRDWITTDYGSHLTFSNQNVGGYCPFTEPVVDPGDERIYNSARMSRAGGTTQVASDATSIAKYFERTLERSDLLHDTDAETLDHANWIVSRFKDLKTSISAITINLANPAVDAIRSTLLGLDFGQLVTVIRQHPSGTSISATCRVEGITHTADKHAQPWIMTLWLSGWDATTDQPWILGDATYGLLGTTTRLGF